MGPLVAGSEMAAGDIVGEVPPSVLAEVLSTPWLAGLLVVLLAIGKLVQLGRALVHGGHGRDPRRTFSRAQKAVLLGRAGHRCEHHTWLLGRCRETEALQADHVHPHSRGGATDVANGPSAVQAPQQEGGGAGAVERGARSAGPAPGELLPSWDADRGGAVRSAGRSARRGVATAGA